jgi:hypothetical protein
MPKPQDKKALLVWPTVSALNANKNAGSNRPPVNRRPQFALNGSRKF